MKFEDLLPRPLHECSEEEIQAVIDKLTLPEIAEFEAEVSKKGKKRPTKAKKVRADELSKAILDGLK